MTMNRPLPLIAARPVRAFAWIPRGPTLVRSRHTAKPVADEHVVDAVRVATDEIRGSRRDRNEASVCTDRRVPTSAVSWPRGRGAHRSREDQSQRRYRRITHSCADHTKPSCRKREAPVMIHRGRGNRTRARERPPAIASLAARARPREGGPSTRAGRAGAAGSARTPASRRASLPLRSRRSEQPARTRGRAAAVLSRSRRAGHQNHGGPVAGADEDVLGSRGAVEEVPRPRIRPHRRPAACTPPTARGTPPAATRSGSGRSDHPARAQEVTPKCGTRLAALERAPRAGRPQSFSEVRHTASLTLTTNQPSQTGARPEPESSSGASDTPRVYGCVRPGR